MTPNPQLDNQDITGESPFDLKTGLERLLLHRIAASIRIAHSVHPESWRIEEVNNRWILAVGFLKVLEIGHPSAIVVDWTRLSDEQAGMLEPQRDTNLRHVSREWAARYHLDLLDNSETLSKLTFAHENAVRQAAEAVRSRVQRWEYHREDLLGRIEESLGETIPTPAYSRYLPSSMQRYSESSQPIAIPNPEPNSAFLAIQSHFLCRGLNYTPHQIATFYTALQTKGFVVLSGISGTGKSKIAQGFVDMIPAPDVAMSPATIDLESVIAISIKPYMRKHRRIVIPVKQEGLLPDLASGEAMAVDLTLNGSTEKARLSRRQDTNSLYLYFRRGIDKHIKSIDVGQMLYLNPVISEVDDEGIEQIEMFTDAEHLPVDVKMLESAEAARNSLFLPVRPDWRDSTSLLGYYNPLTETYEWTEFLRFLLRAVESYRRRDGLAWFVILDEMNLAHVEYYFADLLSIIESGRDKDGWSQEPIRLTYPDAKTDNPPPHEIHLPPNLYIIGTVNMDETTHAFSPKVMDRAFTIELTEVDFSDYPPAPAAEGMELADEERQSLLRAFTRDGAFARIDKGEIRKAVDNHPEIRDWLQALNTELAKHQFQFGYRVFDEIAQFVHNAELNDMFADDSMGPREPWLRAFDHAVYMKVLPKFNGSHARLQGPLTALLQWAKGSTAASIQENDPDIGADGIPVPLTTPRLPRVHDRAKRMLDLLEANGFVSFG